MRPERRKLRVLLLAGLAAVAGLAAPQNSHAVIVNGSGQVTAGGSDLGAYLGAGTLYSLGYTGSRATLANIEGGYAWTGHQSLNTSGQIPLLGGAVDGFYTHPTGVASVLAGRGNRTLDRGIAYGASLYSGTVATSFVRVGSVDKYLSTQDSFTAPYLAAMTGFVPRGAPDGSPTVRADVINSSWAEGPAWNGPTAYSTALDSLIARYGTTVVFASGNEGPSTNTVTSPAGAYNVITVGGLASSVSPEIKPSYDTVSTTSSRSPTTSRLPSGEVGFRNAVSLVAPGENFSVAAYNGPGTVQNFYAFNAAGTSYAAPTVAGAAALLTDVGYDRFVTPTSRTAIDGRVIRAVLMNSATKLAGWNNSPVTLGGTTYTNQALDPTQGAGALNIDRAYGQYIGRGYANPTTGNAAASVGGADAGGATVTPIGWDYETLASTSSLATYTLSEPLLGGSTFTATLTWFVQSSFDPTTNLGSMTTFANLALDLFQQTATGGWRLVAESDAYQNNVEHIYYSLPSTGTYQLRVRYKGTDFGPATPTDFALAWWGTSSIPEPATAWLALLSATLVLRRR